MILCEKRLVLCWFRIGTNLLYGSVSLLGGNLGWDMRCCRAGYVKSLCLSRTTCTSAAATGVFARLCKNKDRLTFICWQAPQLFPSPSFLKPRSQGSCCVRATGRSFRGSQSAFRVLLYLHARWIDKTAGLTCCRVGLVSACLGGGKGRGRTAKSDAPVVHWCDTGEN